MVRLFLLLVLFMLFFMLLPPLADERFFMLFVLLVDTFLPPLLDIFLPRFSVFCAFLRIPPVKVLRRPTPI
jgi:hypothetical protein